MVRARRLRAQLLREVLHLQQVALHAREALRILQGMLALEEIPYNCTALSPGRGGGARCTFLCSSETFDNPMLCEGDIGSSGALGAETHSDCKILALLKQLVPVGALPRPRHAVRAALFESASSAHFGARLLRRRCSPIADTLITIYSSAYSSR